MRSRNLRWTTLLGIVAAAGCAPSVDVDDAELKDNFDPTGGPVAEFDPASSVIPTPNNFIISTTTGKVTIPVQCGESETAAALRTGVLNGLNGFGAWKPALTATFSAPVDFDSLAGKIFLIPLQPGPGAPVQVALAPYTTLRYQAPAPTCGTASPVQGVAIVPLSPLNENTNYAVAILRGVTVDDGVNGSATGEEFGQSFTFALTTQAENPVGIVADIGAALDPTDVTKNETPLDPYSTDDANENGVGDELESIFGLNRLWNAQSSYIGALGPILGSIVNGTQTQPVPRGDLLLAWTFKTQTVETTLDPAATAGPAATLDTVTANTTATQAIPGGTAPQVVNGALCQAAGLAPDCSNFCDMTAPYDEAGKLPCFAVGDAVAGQIVAPRYQVLRAFSEYGLPTQVPSMFTDPANPTQQGTENITYYAFLPAAPPEHTEGYPVVVFGHGITRSKADAFAIASQLNAQGMAVIALDWVAHGARAVQVVPDSLCPGTDPPSPSVQAQLACFQPIFSSDLGSTRDNIRQSVLDVLKLIEVVKTCDTDANDSCGAIEELDSTRIGYLGMSLGAIFGSVISSVSPDIDAAVLNVGAVDLLTVIEETDTNSLKCPLVDSLISSGVLSGKLWITPSGLNNTDALCLTNEWKTQAGYRVFANAARWILDPAEGANFVERIVSGNKNVLMQEVIGDTVVPNEATAVLAALIGLASSPTAAAINTGTASPTSVALSAARAWVRYDSTAAGGANLYGHSSLLAPAGTTQQAAGGTAQMQTDAITYLGVKLGVLP